MSKKKKITNTSLGKKLVQGRNNSKLSIQDIHEKTKIPAHLIKALESDDFENLPARVYVKGFIKSYAKEIGFEYENLVDLLPEEKSIFATDFDQNKIENKKINVNLPMPAISSLNSTDKSQKEESDNSVSSGLIVFILLVLAALSISYFASREENKNTNSPSAQEVSNYDSAG